MGVTVVEVTLLATPAKYDVLSGEKVPKSMPLNVSALKLASGGGGSCAKPYPQVLLGVVSPLSRAFVFRYVATLDGLLDG